MEPLVVDEIQGMVAAAGGQWRLGESLFVSPLDQRVSFDLTAPMGQCSNLYYALIFQLPKWGYVVKKVDEFMVVTPTHAEYYNLSIAQKQKLEGAIKTGLTSAAQAVADFELLAHDARRYREIIDYFKQGQTDEHVLRSLFVDRVDAHTGEGYSMITMAKRWPTIITDFIRLGNKDYKNPDEIRHDLDVSQAEATVLKTKNELYKEWKTLFFPVVKERYARIKTMMDARKKSIQEYKNWLKPYIATYKMMEEPTEKSPSKFLTDPVLTPGFGQAVAMSGIRIWAWRPFITQEMQKGEAMTRRKGFIVDPYDDLVKEFIPKIEERYGLQGEITDKVVRDIINSAVRAPGGDPMRGEIRAMDPSTMYYTLLDIKVSRSIIKTPPPGGSEVEDIMFAPLSNWIVSQNILLIHLIELWARERVFEKYVSEMVGDQEIEERERERIEREFEPVKEKQLGIKNFVGRTRKVGNKLRLKLKPIVRLFIKPGPYEHNFAERITKIYLIGIAAYYGQTVDFLKKKIGAA